ncbi:hypothetical protein U9M48_008321 [Paspalum notatum var. saurae]|uniref:WAT1-related protein n=1 Tax=Paspalum notatum var. saurae TaxID=547442 RepID=A0AAQ3SNU4_PASNO
MGRPPSSSFKAEWGPAICMVLIELFTTGQMLLTKVVVDAGLFVFALLTYRFFIGTVLVVPLAIIFESDVSLPSISVFFPDAMKTHEAAPDHALRITVSYHFCARSRCTLITDSVASHIVLRVIQFRVTSIVPCGHYYHAILFSASTT